MTMSKIKYDTKKMWLPKKCGPIVGTTLRTLKFQMNRVVWKTMNKPIFAVLLIISKTTLYQHTILIHQTQLLV